MAEAQKSPKQRSAGQSFLSSSRWRKITSSWVCGCVLHDAITRQFFNYSADLVGQTCSAPSKQLVCDDRRSAVRSALPQRRRYRTYTRPLESRPQIPLDASRSSSETLNLPTNRDMRRNNRFILFLWLSEAKIVLDVEILMSLMIGQNHISVGGAV